MKRCNFRRTSLFWKSALAQGDLRCVSVVNVAISQALTFDEFLSATDENLSIYYDSIRNNQRIEDIFHNKLLDAFNYYLIIGGMPECVASWIKNKDPKKIEQIQKELITVYENDFEKHNGKVNSVRILLVFRNIVTQLAKENEKFIYGCIKEGARAREFEEAIEWLVSAGMIKRVYNISKPEHPLAAFEQLNHFKLFVFNTELLKHMAGIDNSAILLKSNYQFKRPLTENFVLQQITGLFETEPHYFSTRNGEIDFVIQDKTNIIPIEVKAGEDKSAPSFKEFINQYSPNVAIRFSKMGYVKNGEITSIPLYLVGKIKELI